MLLPNNMRRYIHIKIYAYSYLCYLAAYFRNSPIGVTISSQISDTSMSRIEFSDNDVVTMYFNTEGLSVSCAAIAVNINIIILK